MLSLSSYLTYSLSPETMSLFIRRQEEVEGSFTGTKKAHLIEMGFSDMARSGGFEPPTAWFVARYSIQLSYERVTSTRANHTQFPAGVNNIRSTHWQKGLHRQTSSRQRRASYKKAGHMYSLHLYPMDFKLLRGGK